GGGVEPDYEALLAIAKGHDEQGGVVVYLLPADSRIGEPHRGEEGRLGPKPQVGGLVGVRPFCNSHHREFHASVPVQVPLVDLHDGGAEEGRLDVVAIALPGVVDETETAGKGDPEGLDAGSATDHRRGDDWRFAAIESLIEAGDGCRQ